MCATEDYRRVLVESLAITHLQRIGVDTNRLEQEKAAGLAITSVELARSGVVNTAFTRCAPS